MKYITYSHIGKRNSNEDVVLVKELHPNASLAIIADGMGGYECGDKAAELVVNNLETYLSGLNKSIYTKNDIENALKKSNLAIKHFNEEKNIKSGATIAAAIIYKELTQIFWIGDVQIDIFKDTKLFYRTVSHTLIQDLKKQLDVVSIEMIQKYNHIVTKSISGKREIIDFGYEEISNKDYDSIVISSDGVHNCIDTTRFINSDINILNEFLVQNAIDNNSYIKSSK